MKTWTVQPCTIKCLAEIYEVSIKVIKGHLVPFQDEIGKKVGHFFTVMQVLIIIDRLGIPPHVEIIYENAMPKKRKLRL